MGDAAVGGDAAVWILGSLRYATRRGEADVAALRGHQPRLVLARLAASSRVPVPLAELADALWPGAPPVAWRTTLRSVVSRLRATLLASGWPARNPILSLPDDAYQLVTDGRLWIDAEYAQHAASGAEAAVAAGDHRRAATAGEAAWQLARRRPVLGHDTAFGAQLARRMVATAHRAAIAVARASLGTVDLGQAERFAEAAVDAAPYREDGWRLLLEVHGRRGDMAAVADTFDVMTRRFDAELGVAPHARTFGVYRSIVAAAGRPRMPARPPTGR